jgi:hypothetical protein
MTRVQRGGPYGPPFSRRSQASTSPLAYSTRRPALWAGGPLPCWRQRRSVRTETCRSAAVSVSVSSSSRGDWPPAGSAASGMPRILPRVPRWPGAMTAGDRV